MKTGQSIKRIKLGLGMTTAATLLLELCMVRTFDVILNPTMGYMVVTAAMFALGLGGIYVYLLNYDEDKKLSLLPKLMVVYAASVLLMLPLLNILPFDLNFKGSLVVQVLAWVGMYLTLITPFFISGIVISILFSIFSSKSHDLYFYDLFGAGIGCLLLIPLIPYYGPGGMLFFVAAFLLLAAFLLSEARYMTLVLLVPVATVMIVFPLTRQEYIEFRGHGNKRNIDEWTLEGKRDYSKWDPVSKLGVFNTHPNAKYFALDGGQQASWLSTFDSNFDVYEQEMRENPDSYYYGINSVAHYFKRENHADTLIIGAAVGGETKAALVFGARRVDSIELVGAMVEAAKTRYADFSGNIFNHPRVNYQTGEGRTFLRSTKQNYDIIQMFSNHTSSSIAQGTGAIGAAYLQTAEAYMEYFGHLKKDGLLSINRHIYPRMLTTAALAWHRMGRVDFARHVLVLERWQPDTLPTMLIKMTPWQKGEVESITSYVNRKTQRNARLPTRVKPLPKIFKGHPLRSDFTSLVEEFNGLSVLVGIYGQGHLSYPVKLKLFDSGGRQLGESKVQGEDIRDNKPVTFSLPTVKESRNKQYHFEISSANPDKAKGFSVWMAAGRKPVMQTIPSVKLPEYILVFNPLQLDKNLIPEAFLKQPFPVDLSQEADYLLSPATDDKPYFNMIRKKIRTLDPKNSKYLDGGTAQVLNWQILPFLSSDIITFFVVGMVSLFFSVIFIFLPLSGSSLSRVKWEGRGWYLLYFSCLGAGFIIIELIFIQLFSKLIGYPTHTFATILFGLLFSAGIGSMASKQFGLGETIPWWTAFLAIVIVGGMIIGFYQPLFAQLLKYPLWLRISATLAIISPLGFFMGMPFPLGMSQLGRIEARGIPWAWGMNGFFTVFGGFAGILISLFTGFRIVLMLSLLIYMTAWFAFSRVAVKIRVGTNPS